MLTQYLGIDIAKHKFDVALLVGDTFKMNIFDNNHHGFEQLLGWLKTEGDVSSCHACLESTGQYGDSLAEFLFHHQITVSVVNPAQIKGFSISLLVRNKTDKADAQLIAKFCKANNPYHWQPEPMLIKELKALVRRFDDLKAIMQQEKNRLEFAGEAVKKSIETIISCLKAEMESIEKQLAHCIQTDTDLKEKYQALKSIPGISDRTISRILALCADIEKFNSAKQLAAYAGLNAHHHQSGSTVKEKSRLSKMGHVEFRQALYMPALVAIKHNPIIRSFYERLKARGKPGMVIVCAVMRKLLHMIFGILKNKCVFNPNHMQVRPQSS